MCPSRSTLVYIVTNRFQQGEHIPPTGDTSPVELLEILPTSVPGTLRLVGEMDVSNVQGTQVRLEEELRTEFRLGRQLTLDTSELTFLDSHGIRVLIMLGEQAQAKESPIVILNCSKPVRRALEIAVPAGIQGIRIE
jgi:anti-anti-sigma factor